MISTITTWLQERGDIGVYVVATANDISNLPPELLRKGRFDEIFFVDLPAPSERKTIFDIHIKKRRRDPAKFDVDGLTEGIDTVGWVWPNQSGRGAHVNLAAAGIAANAPNKAEATALLEFLVSEEAQAQFANANNEYPVVSGVPIGEHVAKMGLFIPDNDTPTASFREHAATAQTIFNEVGWD